MIILIVLVLLAILFSGNYGGIGYELGIIITILSVLWLVRISGQD